MDYGQVEFAIDMNFSIGPFYLKVETDDNFERGGSRSSVKDMIKKLQKQNQAS